MELVPPAVAALALLDVLGVYFAVHVEIFLNLVQTRLQRLHCSHRSCNHNRNHNRTRSHTSHNRSHNHNRNNRSHANGAMDNSYAICNNLGQFPVRVQVQVLAKDATLDVPLDVPLDVALGGAVLFFSFYFLSNVK